MISLGQGLIAQLRLAHPAYPEIEAPQPVTLAPIHGDTTNLPSRMGLPAKPLTLCHKIKQSLDSASSLSLDPLPPRLEYVLHLIRQDAAADLHTFLGVDTIQLTGLKIPGTPKLETLMRGLTRGHS